MNTSTQSSSERTAACRRTWEAYTSAWRPENAAQRRSLFAQTLDADCEYRDPTVFAVGWDALDGYMQDFHRQVPGGHFVTTWFVVHHERSVAKWEMRGADASVLGHGVSYAEYTVDGKLRVMNGFFDTP
jgi:hypothetical protein